ncbi:MAG: 2-aminobenzoate-CoA ligase, partial [Sphingomonadales bacterium]|nr:2-aminobenzoate-CoA ligase [Sphingomonadales bacterium]
HVLKPEPGGRWLCSAPIAFTFGLGMQLVFPWRFGGAAVTIEAPGPKPLMEAMAAFGVTHLATAPTAYKAMLGMLPEHDLSSLQTCVSAGEHLPAATWHAWREATGLGLVDGIGATEMMHIFISASGEDIRAGATGRAVPGYQACDLDEEGAPLSAGTGRLAVKGTTGCRYFDDPRQADYVQGGWNVTGDTYRTDEDGYFWYVARSDDMIVSSGYNIAAPEVENALYAHPAVQECAVVGVPCDERGQKVKAFVVPAPGLTPGPELARELQDHVKAAIAPYKYPREVEFVQALPKTATGKLQRFALKE